MGPAAECHGEHRRHPGQVPRPEEGGDQAETGALPAIISTGQCSFCITYLQTGITFLFCSGGHTKENIRGVFVYTAANVLNIQNFEYKSNFDPSLTNMK